MLPQRGRLLGFFCDAGPSSEIAVSASGQRMGDEQPAACPAAREFAQQPSRRGPLLPGVAGVAGFHPAFDAEGPLVGYVVEWKGRIWVGGWRRCVI